MRYSVEKYREAPEDVTDPLYKPIPGPIKKPKDEKKTLMNKLF